MFRILESLNPKQRDAVTTPAQYTQIVAGPGTGKTTTLAAKILYVQTELGVGTDNILGISFSRSAKSQLLKKLEEFTGIIGYGGKPTILTFHSLAYRIIKFGIRYNESRFRNGFERVATEQFIELDPALIKGLCNEYADRDIVNIALAKAYNLIRQGNLTNSPIKDWHSIPEDEVYHIKTYEQGRIRIEARDLITYWKRINKIEKIKNVTDFQGLISEASHLLTLKQQTYETISKSYSYIFVDEYQDTSLAQEELLFSLISSTNSVTVVGDKNQTIYTFNGSNHKNMDRFVSKCKEIAPLSTHEIRLTRNYRSTEEIIKVANEFIGEKTIEPAEECSGITPEVVETHSMTLAAEYVATKIKELVKDPAFTLSDICILYRKNSEFSPQADEVYKQLDKLSLRYNVFQNQDKTESLIDQVLKIRMEYEDEPLNEVIEKLQVIDEDFAELINFIKECMNQGAYDTDDLSEYIVELEEEDADLITETDSLSVKTVHDAKGLEYPIVFILYLGDREFPHSSRPNIDEEKRLLYVGLTRAQKQLYVLGQKGIEFEGFLDNCITSTTKHVLYHSSKDEEKNKGFSVEDKAIIDETTKQLEEDEKKRKEELRKLMDLF
ncbi:DNA helicase-2/ATP-dependent DNA helicase PcrA [Salirhabdus euzebyi]|uniref:DNA 3'-5' helicase n=1 Tax=Salirhabdus euzebyi TaxID=394506 RepID=A0A841PS39_9BACI|nr:ATP-dependent helicase [Salirhabdus euzebyi]MBB6451610.1 DNA helicase-2/ATP-dependent DNA helicase PcrA [Salirhabdus euzebyi]